MSLPSQHARTAPARRNSRQAGKRSNLPLILIACGLAVSASIGWLLMGSGGPSKAGAAPSTPALSTTPASSPATIPEDTRIGLPQAPALAVQPSNTTTPNSTLGHLGGTPAKNMPQGAGAPPATTAPSIAETSAPSTTSMAGAAASSSLPADIQDTINAGRMKIAAGDGVAARVLLSKALVDSRTPEADRAALRDDLTTINQDLVFSPRVDPQDPYTYAYTIQSGDRLIKINQREKLGPDWRLIQRVNRMSSAGALSVGNKLKLIRGPFHAVVTKSAYRMDIFMGPTDKPSEWVFVRSFPVGLGENNATPLGEFRVRPGSKLVNPPWVNPRTGEKFAADDPKNPIGEHWIGLEGVGEYSTITGYGVHGTIDPDSIGQQRSMGCVRLRADDIAQVYELLGEGVSLVKIQN